MDDLYSYLYHGGSIDEHSNSDDSPYVDNPDMNNDNPEKSNKIKLYGVSGGSETIIGGKIQYYVNNDIIYWELFKKIYSNILDPTEEESYFTTNQEHLKNAAQELLYMDLGDVSNEVDDIDVQLKFIYDYSCKLEKMSNSGWYDFMEQHYHLKDGVDSTMINTFELWKHLLESLILSFVSNISINKLSEKNQMNQMNQIQQLIQEIDNLINQGIIPNTSSTLLFALFPPKKYQSKMHEKLSKSGLKILQNFWNVQNIDKCKDAITKFKDVSNDFEYKGICPLDIKNRLIAILSFPIKELIEILQIQNKTSVDSKKSKDYKNMSIILKELDIDSIITKIQIQKKNVDSAISQFENAKINKANSKDKINNKDKSNDKIELKIITQLEKIISIYRQIAPYIEAIEKEYNLYVALISELNETIQKISIILLRYNAE